MFLFLNLQVKPPRRITSTVDNAAALLSVNLFKYIVSSFITPMQIHGTLKSFSVYYPVNAYVC